MMKVFQKVAPAVTVKHLMKIIFRHYKLKRPLFIWGPTGVGKSSIVRQVAEKIAARKNRIYVEWNKLPLKERVGDLPAKKEVWENPEKYFVLFDLRLSQCDPSDLKGLPKVNIKDVVEWLPVLWFSYFSKKNADGIIFLDELNLSPPAVQASAYQLILDRALGEYSLSEHAFVIAAGNRLSDKAYVYDISRALANRFCHVEFFPTVEEWTEWASENNINSMVVAFVNFKSELLFAFDPKAMEVTFPTPRTWEYASDILEEEPAEAVSRAVGSGAAREFAAFIKLRKEIPDPKKLIANPDRAEMPYKESILFALFGTLVELVRRNVKLTENYLKLVVKIPDVKKRIPIMVMAILMLLKNKRTRRYVSNSKIWKTQLSKILEPYILD